MRGSLFVFAVASVLVSACGGAGASGPTPEAPKAVETTSAITTRAEPVDGSRLKEAKLANADAAAKNFSWNEQPSFEGLAQGASFGVIGDEPFVINDIEIQVSEQAGTWSFRARGGESGILGPSITTQGAPVAGKSYSAPMGTNAGYFQAPRPGRSLGTKDFAETVDLSSDNAYVIEITKMNLSADGKTGTASGRFVTMFKDSGADFPAMRAAGTFVDAPVRVWKK